MVMYIQGLIKFGEKKWMDEFQKGNIFLQQILQFQELEKHHSNLDDLAKRGDKYEGAHRVYSHKQVRVFIEDIELELMAPLRVNKDIISKRPIFCMYAITRESVEQFINMNKNFLINPEVENFGDTAVFITDIFEFFKRFETALKKKYNVGFISRLVEYVDVNENKEEWGPFKKPIEYNFQSEYRIMLDLTIENKSLILEIGDITDITYSTPIKNIYNIELVDAEGNLISPTKKNDEL